MKHWPRTGRDLCSKNEYNFIKLPHKGLKFEISFKHVIRVPGTIKQTAIGTSL